MKYLNNLIEDSYGLFSRIKSSIRTVGLVALVGAMISVGVYGCKKTEPASPPVANQPTKQLEENIKSYKDCKIAFISKRDGQRMFNTIFAKNFY